MSESHEECLRSIVRETDLIKWIAVIRQVGIPNAWLNAGALRNTVWKKMYGDACSLVVGDIDIMYYSKDLPMEKNAYFVQELEKVCPTGKWECDNQAWVHLYEPKTDYWMKNIPYQSLEDSINEFWFSVNTIGIRLNDNDEIEILHSEHLPDLFNGILRVLPFQKTNPYEWFNKRIDKIMSKCSKVKVIR